MDIGQAVKTLKSGGRVAREGWNGKGMCLFYMPGYPVGVIANANTRAALDLPDGASIVVLPYVGMRTVSGAIVPWLCSQTDLLAEDWVEVK